ncbi:DUF5685 family protein [Dysosmobacter sp.]
MFGYVRPPLESLPQPERDRFQRAYCGLCHTLGQRYGQAARFILNYDFTYLTILLASPTEAETLQARCPVSPIRPRAYRKTDDAAALAADESVILAYWQLRDGVADHDWLHGMKYLGVSKILEPAYRRAARIRPAFDQTVRRQLQLLEKLEQEQCPSMDQAADAFAVLLEHSADQIEDPLRRRVVRQMLYHLGRWVYLVDAADDLKKDAKSGNYNPVALRFGLRDGVFTAESRGEFAKTLDHSIRMIATAYELWDFGCWSGILEPTIYRGLFEAGRFVLDGTFHTQARKAERKRKKAEETT